MKGKKIAFFIIIAIISGILFWYYIIRIDKNKAVKIIFKANTSRDTSKLSVMDDDYLIAWAKAIKGAESSFDHNGKTYSTGTGTEVKS